MTEENTLTYRQIKYGRKLYFDKYIKYWIQETCSACNGSGYYDHDDSPECEACNGTGKDVWRPDYDAMLTQTEPLIGQVLTCRINSTTDLHVYVNKRREVIYEYDHIDDPRKNERIRSRLYVDYKQSKRKYDWVFTDKQGNDIYLSDMTMRKQK